MKNLYLDGLMGLAVGDAVGVPCEFRSRAQMAAEPVWDMTGFGSHWQMPGTWSDDTSMALCTADSLAKGGFDAADMMRRFAAWKNEAAYTAGGQVFDVGCTCSAAIRRFEQGIRPEGCGDDSVLGNGNGALMRILPASLWRLKTADCENMPFETFIAPVHGAAALTHAHARGLICCGIYTMIVHAIITRGEEETLMQAVCRGWERACEGYAAMGSRFAGELGEFIHPQTLKQMPMDEIGSGGYAVETLHAALRCLLETRSYADCVIMAVNLGGDTDTTAAVAGGLAGLVYGAEGIPQRWRDTLRRREMIEEIAHRLQQAVS